MCGYFEAFFMLLAIINVKSEVINAKVVRTLDIQSQLVKIDSVITIRNLGLSYLNDFIFTIDPDVPDYFVRFISEDKTELIAEKTSLQLDSNRSRDNFRVFLDAHLPYNATYNLQIEAVYIYQIVPLYKSLRFMQNQTVLYKGNLLFYSPYKTVSLETSYIIQRVGGVQTTHMPDNQLEKLTYFHQALEPFSFDPISMEFQNNDPFLVVTSLERLIDVSHYGKIYVEDRIAIKNEGGKLVGPYEHTFADVNSPILDWWYTHLPAAAEDIQFFDSIGTNSKSLLMHFDNYTTFKFQPRHPLLPGWRTSYFVRYRVPTFEYLYHDLQERFCLKMRIVDHVLDDVVIRHVVAKVLLPEGARVVAVDLPRGFVRLEDEKVYTGLCTFGRPTVVVDGSNIVENHIAYFTIDYSFSFRYLLRVPVVLISYLESVFVFCIVLVAVNRKWELREVM